MAEFLSCTLYHVQQQQQQQQQQSVATAPATVTAADISQLATTALQQLRDLGLISHKVTRSEDKGSSLLREETRLEVTDLGRAVFKGKQYVADVDAIMVLYDACLRISSLKSITTSIRIVDSSCAPSFSPLPSSIPTLLFLLLPPSLPSPLLFFPPPLPLLLPPPPSSLLNTNHLIPSGNVDFYHGQQLYTDLCSAQEALCVANFHHPLPPPPPSSPSPIPFDYSYNYALGSVDLDRGQQLYTDLCSAREALCVVNYLHLLYLVTPYDLVEQVKPNWMIYLDEVSAGDGGNGAISIRSVTFRT